MQASEGSASPESPLAPRSLEGWRVGVGSPDLPGGVREGIEAPPPYDAAAAEAAPPSGRSRARSAGRLVREVAETVILALLIFLLVRSVVQNFQVEGSSMEPTLESGWYLLVNKAIYFEINLDTVSKFLPFIDPGDDPTRYVFRGPQRGDVIVFKQPNAPPGRERDFIKRIIGVPGETVEIREGVVYIDGAPLDEPYILGPATGNCAPQRIPPDHFFVLGDNRNNSSDSRVFGPIDKDSIIGKAWVTYWPFSALGFVDSTSVEPQAGAQTGLPKGEVPLTTAGAGCRA